MSLVFLAGPLAGLVVQPLIGKSSPLRSFHFHFLTPPSPTGVLADNSKSRFGRRRPYMLGGSIICFLAMLLMGYTRPFASVFARLGTTAVCFPAPFLFM
jgi:solute carrier family 45 protein 1/2/4